MEGHTFDKVIFLAGLINLRMGMMCSFIDIVFDFSRSVSRTYLREKNLKNRLLDILEVNIMSRGGISFPIASIYSSCLIPSMELKTIACSLDGVFSFAVIVAKLEGGFKLVADCDRLLS